MLQKKDSPLSKEWSWKSSKEGIYLQSRSFKEYGFEHGFFTKEWGNSDPKELVKNINQSLSIHTIKQIHSSKIVNSHKAMQSPWPEADGLVSNKRNESLWIYTADCIPMLFADTRKGFAGASHAGWKGISKGIILKTIEKLESFGSRREELVVALGPAISGERYQVEENVADSIYKSLFSRSEDLLLEFPARIEKLITLGIINHDSYPNKFLLDLRAAAANQLYQAGLKRSQLSISSLCTYSNQILFNSWRREKVKNRQWSMVATSN